MVVERRLPAGSSKPIGSLSWERKGGGIKFDFEETGNRKLPEGQTPDTPHEVESLTAQVIQGPTRPGVLSRLPDFARELVKEQAKKNAQAREEFKKREAQRNRRSAMSQGRMIALGRV